MTLSIYQLQMPNGTVLGAGTGVELAGITGLLDMPSIRQQDTARGQQDGFVAGMNYVGERIVTVTYQITRLPSGTVPETYRALAAAAHKNVKDPSSVAMSSGEYLRQIAGVGASKPVNAVQVQLPSRGNPLMFFGRVTKYSTPLDLNYGYGQMNVISEWTCPDGLLYDGAVSTDSCGLPNPTSGLTFPASAPFVFGASTGGSISLDNTGTYETSPFFVIIGPCTYPTISNTATGEQITLDLTLGASDVVSIDTQSGDVMLNETGNRNAAVATGSVMFKLPAGVSSVGFGTLDSAPVAGTLTGYLLPTYDTV